MACLPAFFHVRVAKDEQGGIFFSWAEFELSRVHCKKLELPPLKHTWLHFNIGPCMLFSNTGAHAAKLFLVFLLLVCIKAKIAKPSMATLEALSN